MISQDNRKHERLEQAMEVYEDVQMVLERLRDIDADLATRTFQAQPATVRAREHVALAREELTALGEIMQAMHMRPSEDSSDDVFSA